MVPKHTPPVHCSPLHLFNKRVNRISNALCMYAQATNQGRLWGWSEFLATPTDSWNYFSTWIICAARWGSSIHKSDPFLCIIQFGKILVAYLSPLTLMGEQFPSNCTIYKFCWVHFAQQKFRKYSQISEYGTYCFLLWWHLITYIEQQNGPSTNFNICFQLKKKT